MTKKALLHPSFIRYIKELNRGEFPSSSINTLEYLKALRNIIKDYTIDNVRDLENVVIGTLNFVIRSRPTAFLVFNVMAKILNEIYKEKNISETKILKIIDKYVDLLSNVPSKTYNYFMRTIENNSVVLIYSFSHTLLELFKRAGIKGTKIIYVYDVFTKYDYNFVMELKEMGIDIVLAPLNAIMVVCRRADIVLMGAEAVFYDGSILNRTGSSIVALVSKKLRKTTYIVSAELKIAPVSSKWEMLTPSLTMPSLCNNYPRLKFLHIPIHEIVPPDYIDYIILELGILKPEDIKEYVNKVYDYEDKLRYENLLWKTFNYNINAYRD